MLATTFTGAVHGIDGLVVRVEVDVDKGISSFRIVGLDSAYFDEHRSGHGFMRGVLNPSQEQFLQEQANSAAQDGQHLILLSHHNGLSLDGTRTATQGPRGGGLDASTEKLHAGRRADRSSRA